MTGQINLKSLLERATEMERVAEELESLSKDLRTKARNIRFTISDIKPQSMEYNVGWIEAK